MIAAAGSRTDYNARFDDSSDGDEDVEGYQEDDKQKEQLGSDPLRPQSGSQPAPSSSERSAGVPGKISKGKVIEQKLRQKLHFKTNKATMSQSVYLATPPKDTSSQDPLSQTINPHHAPMMSRKIEAQAQLSASEIGLQKPKAGSCNHEEEGPSSEELLSKRLMEIFAFESPEKVVSEYPCWLLQSVLLQGYMYLTEKHICFYAYLPKRSNVVAKSGYLSKRGRQNPRYNRYWFSLKGDVLSYYTDPSDLYFPSGNIDLRYGISARLADTKDKSKDTKDFSVTTDHRTYHFRADSVTSAKEWVKMLQKVIFRSHNDGDSIKIAIPLENVLDVEENPVVDFAETCKVRVVESGDTYAIDEVIGRYPVCGQHS